MKWGWALILGENENLIRPNKNLTTRYQPSWVYIRDKMRKREREPKQRSTVKMNFMNKKYLWFLIRVRAPDTEIEWNIFWWLNGDLLVFVADFFSSFQFPFQKSEIKIILYLILSFSSSMYKQKSKGGLSLLELNSSRYTIYLIQPRDYDDVTPGKSQKIFQIQK